MHTPTAKELSTEAAALFGKIRTERDEIALKINLAKAEARDEWQRLEPKWQHFQKRAEEVADTAGETSKDIGAVLGLLGEELRHGYERIRKSLRD